MHGDGRLAGDAELYLAAELRRCSVASTGFVDGSVSAQQELWVKEVQKLICNCSISNNRSAAKAAPDSVALTST